MFYLRIIHEFQSIYESRPDDVVVFVNVTSRIITLYSAS